MFLPDWQGTSVDDLATEIDALQAASTVLSGRVDTLEASSHPISAVVLPTVPQAQIGNAAADVEWTSITGLPITDGAMIWDDFSGEVKHRAGSVWNVV